MNEERGRKKKSYNNSEHSTKQHKTLGYVTQSKRKTIILLQHVLIKVYCFDIVLENA